jgi:hypothetical protein
VDRLCGPHVFAACSRQLIQLTLGVVIAIIAGVGGSTFI